MNVRCVCLSLALLALIAGCASGQRQDVSGARLVVSDSDLRTGEVQGEQVWMGHFAVSSLLSLPATVEVTSKGNGWLAVANADVRVYDGHDDGNLFEPRMLRVLSIDINDDGLMDLLVVGNRVLTNEKGGERLGSQGVAAILLYDRAVGGFRVIEDSGNLVELRVAGAAGRVSLGSK